MEESAGFTADALRHGKLPLSPAAGAVVARQVDGLVGEPRGDAVSLQRGAELLARRDLFYAGLAEKARGVLSGEKPAGAFYAFAKINPDCCSAGVWNSGRTCVTAGTPAARLSICKLA